MDIKINTKSITNQDVDTIIIGIFEESTSIHKSLNKLNESLDGAISKLITLNDYKFNLTETCVIYSNGNIAAERIILVGLGKKEDLNLDKMRHASSAATIKARRLGASNSAYILHQFDFPNISNKDIIRALTEGIILALYKFEKYKTNPSKALKSMVFVAPKQSKIKHLREGLYEGEIIGKSSNLAKDLVNEPPNVCTPEFLAEQSMILSSNKNTKVKILDEPTIKKLNMGAFLSVGNGSTQEPKFIIIEYNKKLISKMKPWVFIGKAITFDTGGYSLKSSSGMLTMKADMSGGAAVIGALNAASQLKVPYPVIGIIPATENMVSGSATRPSDVVTASNGITIEITNTDAEGRLILADALVYAEKYTPEYVIDIATLTGAASIALGTGSAAALFTNEDNLKNDLISASNKSGEKIWQLPLYPEYTEWMKASDISDLRNSPSSRNTGAGTSAAFLQEFAKSYKWAHLDIAPMAYVQTNSILRQLGPSGATGFGVRLLSYLMMNRISN